MIRFTILKTLLLCQNGLLFKGESGVEGNNARASVIFVNPHISYSLYKGFSPYKERRVFFENPTQKIFLLSPCIPKFGGGWYIAKPNRPKTRT
ncbi:hypothetical protein COA08_29760 [Bacillus cereus]|uniref:Uncharacterized protein n=1 Tax=Bacillus cereus TaxID=1396 RepID=A0A2B8SMX6_BACCE|nr:hypothetical protein CON06_30345 [Bacillus cereus]PFA12472.1 hypothetical protein CN382_16095 [Bacillus cereus]PFM38933.1 hypothetical protein COJ43_15875 [Bacillus cereus]PGL54018.1 hypothetical protein CN927_30810 [Bacillus cereus]PGQ04592.1 hypothetical protein COA08_29760 [Bacillus cereus]